MKQIRILSDTFGKNKLQRQIIIMFKLSWLCLFIQFRACAGEIKKPDAPVFEDKNSFGQISKGNNSFLLKNQLHHFRIELLYPSSSNQSNSNSARRGGYLTKSATLRSPMLPEELLTTKISRLTHKAFSQGKLKSTEIRNSEPRNFEMRNLSNKVFSSSLKFETEKQPEKQNILNNSHHLDVSSSEQHRVRENDKPVLTALDIGGNRPTTPTHRFTTPPNIILETLKPLAEHTPSEIRNPPKHREGKKVKSPHNYAFAPTQDPISQAHLQHEPGLGEEIQGYRSALSTFGGKIKIPIKTALPYTPTSTFSPPPISSTPSTTKRPLIIISQNKILTAQGEQIGATKSSEEELPFYRESGGVFLPPRPQHIQEASQRRNLHRREEITENPEYIRSISYRPVEAKLKFPEPTQSNQQYPVRTPPHHRNNQNDYSSHRPQHSGDFKFPFEESHLADFEHQGRFLSPIFPTFPPVTHDEPYRDEVKHFDKKPPPRFDPASDYFYGDPRPPSPTKPPKPIYTNKPRENVNTKEEEKDEEDDEASDEEEEVEDDPKQVPTSTEKYRPHPTENYRSVNENLPNRPPINSPNLDNSRRNAHSRTPEFNNYPGNYFQPFRPSPEYKPNYEHNHRSRPVFNTDDFNPSHREKPRGHFVPSHQAHFDPIYRMTIKEYDDEVKRRDQHGRNIQRNPNEDGPRSPVDRDNRPHPTQTTRNENYEDDFHK